MRSLRVWIVALAAAAGSLGVSRAAGEKPLTSPDGRFAWRPGAGYVLRLDPSSGRKIRRLKLPPLTEENVRRKLLFADNSRYFCVVDEAVSEVGLHLKSRRGAKDAKAVVVGSTLYLMNARGRALWRRKLRERHHLVDRAGLPLQVGDNGSLAVLLEDKDRIHVNPRPLLVVLGPRGRERLRLDYLDWRRVDEFRISPNGRYLAVRGYGRIEDEEDWGDALALYDTGSGKKSVRKARLSRSGEAFEYVNNSGNVCCATVDGRPHEMDIGGRLRAAKK